MVSELEDERGPIQGKANCLTNCEGCPHENAPRGVADSDHTFGCVGDFGLLV